MEERPRYLVSVSSIDRFPDPGNTSSNFRIQLGTSIGGQKGIRSIRLESCMIPFTWTLNPDGELYIPLSEDGVTFVKVYYPTDNYANPTQFATNVSAILTTASPNGYTYVVSYNSQSLQFTTTCTGNFSYMWYTDFLANPKNYFYNIMGYATSTVNIGACDDDTPLALTSTSSGAASVKLGYLFVTITPKIPVLGVSSGNQMISFVVKESGNYGSQMYTDSFGNYPVTIEIANKGVKLQEMRIEVRTMAGYHLELRGAQCAFVFSYTLYDDE